jgi:hypothetical protein
MIIIFFLIAVFVGILHWMLYDDFERSGFVAVAIFIALCIGALTMESSIQQTKAVNECEQYGELKVEEVPAKCLEYFK